MVFGCLSATSRNKPAAASIKPAGKTYAYAKKCDHKKANPLSKILNAFNMAIQYRQAIISAQAVAVHAARRALPISAYVHALGAAAERPPLVAVFARGF